jgi:DNA-binding response OmpR family regulator
MFLSEQAPMTKKVLIADDDRDLVAALSARCKALGLAVDVAHNAVDALNLINYAQPDLVCLDVNMPSGSGLSVCEMIQSEPRWADTPVIILTGRSDDKTIHRCHSMCAYYVQKCTDVWQRIEPLLVELLHLERSDRPQPDAALCGASRDTPEPFFG